MAARMTMAGSESPVVHTGHKPHDPVRVYKPAAAAPTCALASGPGMDTRGAENWFPLLSLLEPEKYRVSLGWELGL